jgi:ATP-dependent Lhr-like helicase
VLRTPAVPAAPFGADPVATVSGAEFTARRLLARTGVVFRRTLARERQPVPWRDVARALRTLEARGEVRGGRFVAGFDGEQYALPEAVAMLRETRRREAHAPETPEVVVSAADPLNFRGILTPDERVAATARKQVRVA